MFLLLSSRRISLEEMGLEQLGRKAWVVAARDVKGASGGTSRYSPSASRLRTKWSWIVVCRAVPKIIVVVVVKMCGLRACSRPVESDGLGLITTDCLLITGEGGGSEMMFECDERVWW